jgi:UDP-galactopyranose mutase
MTEESKTIPEEFKKVIRDFVNDLRTTFPEYTNFINKILDNKNISVLLNTDYDDYIKLHNIDNFKHIIYTGPIDVFYKNSNLENLEYRSISFVIEKYRDTPYYQTNSIVNYLEKDIPYTRIVEYKHFLNQKSNDTIIVKEITTDDGEPYYPIPNKKNLDLYEKYKLLTLNEKKVHFLGRLANYKYFNMDAAILNALEYFDNNFTPSNL